MATLPESVADSDAGHLDHHAALHAQHNLFGRPGDYSAVADVLLHDCENLSNAYGTWTAVNRYATGTTQGTDATIFTQGTKSVYAILNASSDTNPDLTARFYCDLASPQAVDDTDWLLMDLRAIKGGVNSLFWDPEDVYEVWVADGAGLTGTVLKFPFPSVNGGSSSPLKPDRAFPLVGLTSVASFGIVSVANTTVNTALRTTLKVDNVRIKGRSDVEAGLAAGPAAGMFLDSEAGQIANWPARRHTDKPIIDLRGKGGFWSSAHGVHLREIVPDIDTTGTVDVTDTLQSALDSLQPHDYLYGDPDAVYRVDGDLVVSGIDNVILDWQGGIFYNTSEPTGSGAMWTFAQMNNVRMRNFRAIGFRSATNTGSAMSSFAGSPTVSGTDYLLAAQNDAVRMSRKSDGEMPFYARTKDGTFKIDFTLSDSAQVANDCSVTLVDEDGNQLYRRVLTLTATPTSYTFEHLPSDLTKRVEWRITKTQATTNTITVGGFTEYGRVGYNAANALYAGLTTGREVRELHLEDFLVEGFGGDGFGCSSKTRGLYLRRFVSRACRRQAVSFNGDVAGVSLVRMNDWALICPARHGIDLEPETNQATVADIRLTNGEIYGSELGGFVANGWSRITDLHVTDIYEYPGASDAVNFDGGAFGGTVSRYYVASKADIASGNQGQITPSFVVAGQGMHVSDITCDRGFALVNSTSDNNDGTHSPRGNYATNIKIRRSGTHAVALCQADASKIENVTLLGPEETFTPGKGGVTGFSSLAVQGRQFAGMDLFHQRNHFPQSYPGVAYSSLWQPLGLLVCSEPVLAARGLGGRGSAITVKSSSTITTTTSSAAVAVTPLSLLQLTLDITAASGTAPLLTVVVEASHDQTTWRPVAAFNPHTVACRETRDVFLGTEPWVRVTGTVAGTSPSFTYAVTGQALVAANNLSGADDVTTAATTATVTFPTRSEISQPTNLTVAAATGGTLTPSTAYFYKIAARRRYGGPLAPSVAEKTLTLGATDNAVTLSVSSGVTTNLNQAEGFTIYRGTATGVYDTRFDFLPVERLWGSRGGLTLVDKGDQLTFTLENYISGGYPTAVCAESGSFTPVDESGYEIDTDYRVQVTPSWLTQVAVTAKRRDGFDLAFDTAAPAGATVDWFIVR